MPALIDLFSQSYATCRGAVLDHWGVLTGLFLTGVVGSVTHCAGMCGPFVLAQVGARLETVSIDRMAEWRRLTGAALLPYHLGRMTTYGLLGALAAGMAGRVSGGGMALQWLSVVLLGGAALTVTTVAFPKIGKAFAPDRGWPVWGREAGWAGLVTAKARVLFENPVGFRGYGLGVVLGFIPCGLLYAALSSAAALGSASAGALGMAVFTLGTVPSLVVTGVAGQVAAGMWRKSALAIAPWLLLANGAFLGGLAVTMMAKLFEGGATR